PTSIVISTSSRVVGVDPDVLRRQVATPGLGGAPSQPQVGADLDLRLLEGTPDRLQVDLDSSPGREHRQPGDLHAQAIDGEVGAAVAERADDAAPVWVAAVDGGLDQVAGGHGSGR